MASSCNLKIDDFHGASNLISSSGGNINLSGSISDDSGKPISWTIDVAGKTYTGTGISPSAIWDGKDGSGKVVDPGVYSATLTVQAADGKCSGTKTISFTVQPPPDNSCSLYVDFGSSANVASGALVHSQEIFSIKGTGLATNMTLFYNSQDPHSASLGTGWSHSYDVTLKTNNDGSMVLHEGNGKRKLYTLANGAYASQTGDYSTLVKNGESSFLLTQKDGTTYRFNTQPVIAEGGTSTVVPSAGDGGSSQGGDTTRNAEPYTRDEAPIRDGDRGGDPDPIPREEPPPIVPTPRYEEGKVVSIADRNGNTVTFTYSGNNLASVTDPSGRTVGFVYDAVSHLTAITDPSGNAYTFTVAGNSLATVTQPDGGVWKYIYDANGFMLTKTDPLGNVTSYGYDDKHRVFSSIDPEGRTRSIAYPQTTETIKSTTFTEKDGGVWQYNYDTRKGYLLGKTDPQGGTTSYGYDSNGNRISTTDPDGTTTTYTYDASGNMISSTDAIGQTTGYTYNTFGQVLSITDVQGGTTTYAYDAKGNMTSLTDPAGAITTYAYDTKGKITKVTNAAGQSTIFSYDAKGNLASVTDPSGVAANYVYDAVGNVTSITDAKGAVTQFVYDTRNRLIKTIDPQGNATLYSFDANGNKLSETDANGNTTRYEYNSRNQLIKSIDALGSVTSYAYGGTACPSCGGGADKLTAITDANWNKISFEYDALGRKIKETDAAGNPVTYTYDARGNVITRTDALGRVTTFEYDPLNRVRAQIDSLGGRTEYDYSPKGQLAKVVDPIGNATTYEYDAGGRNISTASPDAGTTTFSYNIDGTLKNKTDANGTTITYDYDTAGRLIAMKYPDAMQNVTYSYDTCPNGKGKLCSMSDTSGTTSYSYDILGRGTKEQKIILDVTYTTSYAYTKTGRLASITYPSGRTITYTRDILNRTTAVTSMLRGTTALVSGIGYDPVGNLTNLNYGNGLSLSRSYNPTNQIRSIAIPGIINTANSYDPVGNITSIPDALDSTRTKNYAYDSLDRLQSAQGPWGSLNWAYDANGNRLSQKNGTNYIYTYEGNRLTTVTNGTTATYSYNANGNTLGDGTKQFIYNQNSRLIKTVENGKTLGEYTYNGKGERVIKRTGPAATSSASSQNTVYHYDRNGRLIEETAGDGKFLADYVYLDGTPLALIRKQGNNEETFFYHNDHLGAPKIMTDKLGKVVWNVEFDPFGNDISSKARQGAYIRNVENNFRFPGQYYDAETGLHYNYFRDYSPKTGRYIESDPIGLRGGLNIYNYVQNNPLILVDPSGLCPAGTHEATPNEVKQILAAAKDIEDQNLSYKDIKCNQFVDRSINNAFPKSLSQEYTTSQIRQGEGPFEKTDSPAVGELALLKTPGHVVLISETTNGKVSQFKGSQTSTGPNTVDLPDYFWQKRLNASGNVNYYKVCLPN